MIPEGTDAISPAPHHDIYSIEDLRQLVYSLKEATDYCKPVIVKVAAVHNIAAIASGIARSGADVIAIDGFRGGTGAAPTRIRDNVGIPIELALAAVDQRLRDEGIRNDVSLVVGGSVRSASDVVKAIALGADACYIATAALLALGCHLCRTCQTGKCNWGIATQRPDLVKRLNPDVGSERLIHLMNAWRHEIKELMGGMGINSVEALRGNRLMLPRIHIEGSDAITFAVSCRHCTDPLCVKSCIAGAIRKQDGVVRINQTKCVGCLTCVLVCPYGALAPNENGVMQKCELCLQNTCEEPACVTGCPNRAIVYEEREEDA